MTYRTNASDEYSEARRTKAMARYARVFSVRNVMWAIALALLDMIRSRTLPTGRVVRSEQQHPPNGPVITRPASKQFIKRCIDCGAHFKYEHRHCRNGRVKCPSCGEENLHMSTYAIG